MPIEPITTSIVVPMRNEAATLPSLLEHLKQIGQQPGIEVLLVDGGSEDNSVALARAAGFEVAQSQPGRAVQMNTGAGIARGQLLVFLHADTRLPLIDLTGLGQHLQARSQTWGRFDVRIAGRSRWLPMVATMMNLRSRVTGIATGDQCLFVTRTAFEQVGGFPLQALMEDIEICARLKRQSRPLCLRHKAITSGRRWDEYGTWRTIGLMWRLRWAYWRGEQPGQLWARYHGVNGTLTKD